MTKKYSLYVKTHRTTGLKYLGQTTKDPLRYKGSGYVWLEHLKQNGNLVDTEILLETTDHSELSKQGRYYSELWNIVESTEWANKKPETGQGGHMGPEALEKFKEKMKGHPNWLTAHTSATKKLIGEASAASWASLTLDQKHERIMKMNGPETWTPERIENMRKGMLGKKKTKTPKLLAAIDARKEQSLKNMLAAAEKNRGRTWKLVDGKRVWMDKI